jgi:ferredoxin-NADP reductase
MKVIFKKKFAEGGNAVSFILEPEKPVNWEAGQYISYEIPGLPPSNDERTFTISSAPYEKHFQITTRITDSTFKQQLNNLKPGTELEADQVGGDFTWVDTNRPIIFVAGGIGVTPYHSILKQRAHDNKPLTATLLYANRDDNLVFKAELDKLAATHPEFGIHYVIGEQLNAQKMRKLAPQLNESLIYLSGPESMVDSFEEQLSALGIPKDQLKQDWFPGYTVKTY